MTGTPATLAARDATDTIPIVQVSGTVDLVREGAVTSLARPGGNVTGLATIGDELTAKRLDLLRQTVPGLRRVAVLGNPASRSTAVSWQETETAAREAGIDLQALEVRSPDELESLMTDASRGRAQGLFLLIDPLTVAHRARIAGLARAHHLPSIFDRREFAVDGGLLSYGPNYADIHRRGAVYVDKILKGAQPADLPIERESIEAGARRDLAGPQTASSAAAPSSRRARRARTIPPICALINGGRPSIDPVVFFKLQLVVFFEGIGSEQELVRVAADRLSLRWYAGYALHEPLPEHSTLTRIRQRYGLAAFRRFFEQIVEQGRAADLV